MVGTNDYHATLVHFMTFTNGIAYPKDHPFVQQDELAPLTPDDIARWLCQKAYGTPEPEPDPDANPTQARSSSLHYWKKAISYYMPNHLMPWNAISGQGNPTRSIEVNTLIKKVKKKEVRKQGVSSKARRAVAGHFSNRVVVHDSLPERYMASRVQKLHIPRGVRRDLALESECCSTSCNVLWTKVVIGTYPIYLYPYRTTQF